MSGGEVTTSLAIVALALTSCGNPVQNVIPDQEPSSAPLNLTEGYQTDLQPFYSEASELLGATPQQKAAVKGYLEGSIFLTDRATLNNLCGSDGRSIRACVIHDSDGRPIQVHSRSSLESAYGDIYPKISLTTGIAHELSHQLMVDKEGVTKEIPGFIVGFIGQKAIIVEKACYINEYHQTIEVNYSEVLAVLIEEIARQTYYLESSPEFDPEKMVEYLDAIRGQDLGDVPDYMKHMSTYLHYIEQARPIGSSLEAITPDDVKLSNHIDNILESMFRLASRFSTNPVAKEELIDVMINNPDPSATIKTLMKYYYNMDESATEADYNERMLEFLLYFKSTTDLINYSVYTNEAFHNSTDNITMPQVGMEGEKNILDRYPFLDLGSLESCAP